jgi:hypothetical protein
MLSKIFNMPYFNKNLNDCQYDTAYDLLAAFTDSKQNHRIEELFENLSEKLKIKSDIHDFSLYPLIVVFFLAKGKILNHIDEITLIRINNLIKGANSLAGSYKALDFVYLNNFLKLFSQNKIKPNDLEVAMDKNFFFIDMVQDNKKKIGYTDITYSWRALEILLMTKYIFGNEENFLKKALINHIKLEEMSDNLIGYGRSDLSAYRLGSSYIALALGQKLFPELSSRIKKINKKILDSINYLKIKQQSKYFANFSRNQMQGYDSYLKPHVYSSYLNGCTNLAEVIGNVPTDFVGLQQTVACQKLKPVYYKGSLELLSNNKLKFIISYSQDGWHPSSKYCGRYLPTRIISIIKRDRNLYLQSFKSRELKRRLFVSQDLTDAISWVPKIKYSKRLYFPIKHKDGELIFGTIAKDSFIKKLWKFFYWKPNLVIKSRFLLSNENNAISLQYEFDGKYEIHYNLTYINSIDVPSTGEIIIDNIYKIRFLNVENFNIKKIDPTESCNGSLNMAECRFKVNYGKFKIEIS